MSEPSLLDLRTRWTTLVYEYNAMLRAVAELDESAGPDVHGKMWKAAEEKRLEMVAAHDVYNAAAVANARRNG